MQRSTDFNMILAPVRHHAVYVYIPEVYSAIRKYGYFVVTTVTIYRHFFISLRRHVYKNKKCHQKPMSKLGSCALI